MTNVQVWQHVTSGLGIARPAACPLLFYTSVIQPCFAAQPADRPGFFELFREIHRFDLNGSAPAGPGVTGGAPGSGDRSNHAAATAGLLPAVADVHFPRAAVSPSTYATLFGFAASRHQDPGPGAAGAPLPKSPPPAVARAPRPQGKNRTRATSVPLAPVLRLCVDGPVPALAAPVAPAHVYVPAGAAGTAMAAAAVLYPANPSAAAAYAMLAAPVYRALEAVPAAAPPPLLPSLTCLLPLDVAPVAGLQDGFYSPIPMASINLTFAPRTAGADDEPINVPLVMTATGGAAINVPMEVVQQLLARSLAPVPTAHLPAHQTAPAPAPAPAIASRDSPPASRTLAGVAGSPPDFFSPFAVMVAIAEYAPMACSDASDSAPDELPSSPLATSSATASLKSVGALDPAAARTLSPAAVFGDDARAEENGRSLREVAPFARAVSARAEAAVVDGLGSAAVSAKWPRSRVWSRRWSPPRRWTGSAAPIFENLRCILCCTVRGRASVVGGVGVFVVVVVMNGRLSQLAGISGARPYPSPRFITQKHRHSKTQSLCYYPDRRTRRPRETSRLQLGQVTALDSGGRRRLGGARKAPRQTYKALHLSLPRRESWHAWLPSVACAHQR